MSRVQRELIGQVAELLETLSRELLILEHAHKEGRVDPALVQNVFRQVHSLKGIAGMLEQADLTRSAHYLESALDDLRMERVPLTQQILDDIFERVERLHSLLEGIDGSQRPDVVSTNPPGRDVIDSLVLSQTLLSVLTEYEEHRLRSNIEQGVPLFSVRGRLGLDAIDRELESLSRDIRPLGEVIAFLPGAEVGGEDSMEIEALLASRSGIEELTKLVGARGLSIAPVERRPGSDAARPGSAPAPPGSLAPRASSHPPSTASIRAPQSTLRVNVDRVDRLLARVGEMAGVRAQLARAATALGHNRGAAREIGRLSHVLERRLDLLQESLLAVRMVPVAQVFDKVARLARQLAREHRKNLQVVVTGADTEMDRLIVDELADPLMHLVRNAVDHGIEPPSVRDLTGKPASGTLALNAFQRGHHAVIEVEDDGVGLSEEAIADVAVRRGFLQPRERARMSRDEILKLIFLPGFTTKDDVTALSGRGVGMDVVRTNVARLGGVVDVSSELGTGTKFALTLPITFSFSRALVAKVGSEFFVFPVNSLREVRPLGPTELFETGGRTVVSIDHATLPVIRLDAWSETTVSLDSEGFLLVVDTGHRAAALVVDHVLGQQDIFIQPLGRGLASTRGFVGATDLGERRIALVVDVAALLDARTEGAVSGVHDA